MGKTTSAVHTAAVAAARGYEAVVLDADDEHSASRWAEAAANRGIELPFQTLRAEPLRLAAQAKELSCSKVVIIDTPPNQRDLLMQAAGISDACIVPVSPTALDTDRLASTLTLLGSLEAIKPELNVSILITRLNRSERSAREIYETLRVYPILEHHIRDLVRYKDSFGTAPGFLEEYDAVWKELHA
ncbi:MAG: ParA family protein [Pleurocapsa sp. SU_196_0]|nr:ParA family protein [Pleurocapsa sp. SU_196_0]